MSEALPPAPQNIFKHARAEVRKLARSVRGLLALDDVLGEMGDIEQLLRDKRLELGALEARVAELEAKKVELGDVEADLARGKALYAEFLKRAGVAG